MFTPVFFVGLFVGLLIIGYFTPNTLLGRLVHTTLATLGLKARRYEEANALGRYDRALASQSGRIMTGVTGMGDHQAIIRSLERQKDDLEGEIEELEGKIDFLDGDGVPDTDPIKTALAEKLIKRQGRLEHVQAELTRHKEIQAKGQADLRTAHSQVRETEDEREELASDLDAATAEESVGTALTGFYTDTSRHDLSAARRDLQKSIDKKRGRTEVMQEVFGKDVAEKSLDDRMAASKAAKFLEARRAKKAENGAA